MTHNLYKFKLKIISVKNKNSLWPFLPSSKIDQNQFNGFYKGLVKKKTLKPF